jgi:LuxR family maltose regulon positive regulatory protein
VSNILLATKIRKPPLRRDLVGRPQLIQRLNDGITQNNRLIIISAPAGYGKSTLVREWESQIDTPVAWLSLEKSENTSTRFWNYFINALSSIPHLQMAGIGESLYQALQSPKPPSMDVLLIDLINDFSKNELSAIMVLDDLHTITQSQIHHDLIFLIEHLPITSQGLHLVIISRMDPPWPLGRWRARGELIELRSSDLRFSTGEVFQLLNQVMQFNLSAQDIDTLQERTEGWIAGLQMASVSIQGRMKTQGTQGVTRFIESFSGTNRFILDYLMEEVISQQPEEVRDFLYETSILEQFTAPLCDAISGRHDSDTILDHVAQANLFLIPLDDERQWYRYHHLFAELLRKRLKQTLYEHINDLHRRASEWYAQNNLLSEAIIHALDAGDYLRVNELVSGNALAIVEHSELLGVLRHFEELPDQQISLNPWLGVAYAWTKAYAEPTDEIDQIIQEVELGLADVEESFEKQRITSHLNAIRAYVAWVKGEANEALEYAQCAAKNLPSNDWMIRAHVLNIEGLALQYSGNLSAAVKAFEASIVAGQRAGKFHEIFNANFNLAYLYYLRGRLHQAFSLCQQTLDLVDNSALDYRRNPVFTYAFGTMSLVQLEWNDVDSALWSAQESLSLAEQWKQADAMHFALTCLSKVLCAVGNLEKAFAINQRAMQLATYISPWYFRLSACNEVWLNLVKGDIVAAEQRMKEIEPLVNERDRKYTFLICKSSLLYSQGKYLEVLQAVENHIIEHEQKELFLYLLNILPLQALAMQALGREEVASRVICYCLKFAEPEGFVRIFVERGESMVRLLKSILSQGMAIEYINRLLPAFNRPNRTYGSGESSHLKTSSLIPGTGLVEPLSECETRVLRLLDSPLTNEEIGRELFVSVNTIRTHIKNIYTKLEVNRRGDAVRRAKTIGLL